jgi:hypothetical protein
MPLIDLKTNLKSLKYGSDRIGGGNSGQPYIQTDINKPGTNLIGNFDDGLVRGGAVGAAKASIVDTLRIGKFLTDFPKGPLFIAKQVGLQLSNPKLEVKLLKTDNPTSGGGLLSNVGNFIVNVANKISNFVGPTRIYNLGINTIAQVPINAFGQHVIRHGFSPVRNDNNSYFKVVQHNNEGENAPNNRLVQLKSILGNTNNISTYLGGPSSAYGIGTTIIQRRGNFIDINRDTTATTWATSKEVNNSSYVQSFVKNIIATTNLKIGKDLGLSKKTYSMLAGNLEIPIDPTGSAAYDKIASKKDKHGTNKDKQSFSYTDATNNLRSGSFTSVPTSKSGKRVDKLSLDNTIASDKDKNYPPHSHAVSASKDLGLSLASTNLINLASDNNINLNQNVIPGILPTNSTSDKYVAIKKQFKPSINQNNFKTIEVNVSRGNKNFAYVANELKNKFNRTNDKEINNDTLALIFTPLDPFTGNALNILKFLGYLTDFTENYDSSWSDVKYAGRAEKFYIFNEFKRSVSVGFNIPCFNENELEDRHCAISELASSLAGKYENNLLGGILIKLKLGGYINEQPGIITNLSFQPIQDSSWDLYQGLAFYLKVSFSFTLIHNFLPQYQKCGFIFAEPNPTPPVKKPTPTPPLTPPELAPIPGITPLLSPSPLVGSFIFTNDKEKTNPPYVKKPLTPITERRIF